VVFVLIPPGGEVVLHIPEVGGVRFRVRANSYLTLEVRKPKGQSVTNQQQERAAARKAAAETCAEEPRDTPRKRKDIRVRVRVAITPDHGCVRRKLQWKVSNPRFQLRGTTRDGCTNNSAAILQERS